jgi:hypothetical protein
MDRSTIRYIALLKANPAVEQVRISLNTGRTEIVWRRNKNRDEIKGENLFSPDM